MPLNVLITGANSGFGLLTAQKFAEAGHTVHATLRNPEKAQALNALKERGLKVELVSLDVTEPDSVTAAVETASKSAPIDVLVNNAGFEVRGPIEHLTDELLLRQFDTNVMGVVRMVRAVTPSMRERRSGTIVNISSVAGQIASPYTAAYSSSKHALEALSEALWFELRPFGVRVVVIEPGGFETAFGANVVTAPDFDATSPYAAVAARFDAAMAGFRVGPPQNPQEVADLVFEAVNAADPKLRYLAGDDARMLVPLFRSMEFEAFASVMLQRLGLSDVVAPPSVG